jgi:hypothetical protein
METSNNTLKYTITALAAVSLLGIGYLYCTPDDEAEFVLEDCKAHATNIINRAKMY